jgi:hypothetical protein
MFRVIGAVFLGFAAAFGCFYLLSLGFVQIWLERPAADLARMNSDERAKYEQDVLARHEQALRLSIGVGAVCGLLAGARSVELRRGEAGAKGGQPATHVGYSRSRPEADSPLKPEQFELAFRLCSWVKLEDKTPAYLQGFLVAALAEPAPEMASRIDRFSDVHMAAILADFRRRQRDLG